MKLHRTHLTYILPCLMVCAFALFISSFKPSTAHAAPTSSFKPGHIIDDGIFFNPSTLNANDVQAFLNSKVPACDTNGTQPSGRSGYPTRADWGRANGNPPPYVCLKSYTQAVPNIGPDAYCGGAITGGTLSAAQIITVVSGACSINPQVLIVLLQKEQGLITDDWPWSGQYRSATGYGCPDTAPCDAEYYGFFNQVYNAAHQFQRYVKQPDLFNFAVGRTSYVQYNPQASCGGTNVYMQSRSTAALYNYTPYQPNSSALSAGYGSAPPCGAYGNRNFWLYFNDWFGTPYMPMAFKSSSSSAVYVYVSGFKIAAPSMAILQDYGISPQSIQTLSQSSVDAVPSPGLSDGISTTLSYLIKSPSDTDADGSTVYLISVGQKYGVISMQQFTDFGFNGSNLAYLPLGFINSIAGNGPLSYYLQTPQSLVFKIEATQKRPIFDFQTFISLNPGGSVSPVSYSVISTFSPGAPLTIKDILIRQANSNAVYLLTPSNNYYGFASFDAYICSGVATYLNLPFIQLSDNSYIAPINPVSNLTCVVNDGQSNNYLLSNNVRYTIPASFGSLPSQTLAADVLSTINRLPLSTSPLKQAIKSSSGPTIWFLENGTRRPIPSISNYQLLGLSSLDIVDNSSLASIPVSGIKLGTGQPVKTSNSSTVYIVSGNNRLAVGSSDDFIAHQYNWNNIETYSVADLDTNYPFTGSLLNKYFFDTPSNSVYLIDHYGCYKLDSSMVTRYGKDQSQIQASQTYGSSVFPGLSLSNCKSGSRYVKQNDQPIVYLIENGQKRAFSTWSSLVAHSGQSSPNIINLSSGTISSFPDGSPIN